MGEQAVGAEGHSGDHTVEALLWMAGVGRNEQVQCQGFFKKVSQQFGFFNFDCKVNTVNFFGSLSKGPIQASTTDYILKGFVVGSINVRILVVFPDCKVVVNKLAVEFQELKLPNYLGFSHG